MARFPSASDIVADFDRIADALAADPHPVALTPSERFLLRQVPAHARRALDVGCGDGALSRALALRGIATTGIDVSPRMIALARTRADGNSLLDYRVADITTESPPDHEFDLVVSVSMAHHAPLERVVEYLRSALAPGGTLLIQDLTTRHGARYLLVNAAALLARHVRQSLGKDRRSAAVAALYEAHGNREQYLHPSEVARAYRGLLPGAQVHLHLEWRYTVVWQRPVSEVGF